MRNNNEVYTINERGYKTSLNRPIRRNRITSSNGMSFWKELQKEDEYQEMNTSYNLKHNQKRAERMKALFNKQQGAK